MSVVAVDQPLELDRSPRTGLRPLAHAVPLDDDEPGAAHFQLWEIHSELVLVSPELRMRSLELLPEPADVLAVRPRQGITTARAPQIHEDETEPEVVEIGVLRYTAHRVAEV